MNELEREGQVTHCLHWEIQVLSIVFERCKTILGHSHSMVAGGLLLTSSTTLLIPRTSLMMRPDTFLSKL
jgi:hypothetical protein